MAAPPRGRYHQLTNATSQEPLVTPSRSPSKSCPSSDCSPLYTRRNRRPDSEGRHTCKHTCTQTITHECKHNNTHFYLITQLETHLQHLHLQVECLQVMLHTCQHTCIMNACVHLCVRQCWSLIRVETPVQLIPAVRPSSSTRKPRDASWTWGETLIHTHIYLTVFVRTLWSASPGPLQ